MLDFGSGCLATGWSAPEPHYVWAMGSRSKLLLPQPHPSAFGHELRIMAHPFEPPGHAQALRLICNGHDIGEYPLIRDVELVAPIAPDITQGRGRLELDIVPRHALSPHSVGTGDDVRELAFALFSLRITTAPLAQDWIAPPVDGVPDRTVMMGFESLAEDCEFGFAQRAAGADPLGLLRWGGMRAHVLDEALSRRFEGIDDPAEVGIAIQGGGDRGEYKIVQRRYHYSYHTFVNSWEMAPEELMRRELIRLAYGRRRLLEDLAEGEKLFVVKSSQDGGLRLDQVAPLAELIAGYGPGVMISVVAEY